jgi:hypothetical protein
MLWIARLAIISRGGTVDRLDPAPAQGRQSKQISNPLWRSYFNLYAVVATGYQAAPVRELRQHCR